VSEDSSAATLVLDGSSVALDGSGAASAGPSSSASPSPRALPSSHSSVAAPSSPARPRTRLQEGVCKPKVYIDGTVHYGCYTSTGEPQNLEEALGDKNWKNAMDIEYDALMKNKTWHLIPPQKGRNVIDCRWVFKVKRKADGSLDKYKARC
jgi:hypothetical protein